jgi:transposase-like protein
MNMSNKRKKYSAEEKVRLLRLHLIEKEPVSDICDRHGLNPNVFYRWQKLFFENGAAAFNQAGNGRKDGHAKKLERQNAQLKDKLASKDEVIAEIMASHVQLKKSLGEA